MIDLKIAALPDIIVDCEPGKANGCLDPNRHTVRVIICARRWLSSNIDDIAIDASPFQVRDYIYIVLSWSSAILMASEDQTWIQKAGFEAM
jgi:hypothetical protein